MGTLKWLARQSGTPVEDMPGDNRINMELHRPHFILWCNNASEFYTNQSAKHDT